MKSAIVVTLSPSQQAVVAYHPSGKPSSLTLLRGREAWTMTGSEAERLAAALVVRAEAPEPLFQGRTP